MDALTQYDFHHNDPSAFQTLGVGRHDFTQAQFDNNSNHFYQENIQPATATGSATSASIAGSSNNNNSYSNSKFRRPCDACRRRKSRCVVKDGAVKCVLCDFHHQACTYVQSPQARKRKSVSISQDEEVLVSPSKRSSSNDLLRRRSVTQQTVTSPQEDQSIDDYANLKGPSLLKKTLGLQRRRHGIYQGSSGGFELALIVGKESLSSSSRVFSHGTAQVLCANEHDHFLLLQDEATDHYDEEQTDNDAIEAIVAPHGQALVNLYFRIVHPSFPILHKKVFLEKYSRTHQEFSPPLLAAVYILALQYWSYENELVPFKKPEVGNLEKLAMKSLAYVVNRPKLSTVEAGLLLLQWRTGRSSWALTAQMVAIGQELGLHQDCSTWNIPAWERGLRNRLSWALFMQDKWSSLIHGRPSHISEANWAIKPLTERDFPEKASDDDEREGSTEIEKGRSIFCHMASLTQILADVLQDLYSGSAERQTRALNGGANVTKFVLSRAKPLQIRLNHWHANLPASLSIGNVTIRKLSSTGYLHLAYWATEISLHRCIFRTLPDCSSNEGEVELTSICLKAATTRLSHAISFVKSLKAEHLQSFWYFASAFNFALVGIFQALLCVCQVASTKKEERVGQVAVFDEYRWLLRISSKSAPFLEQSMEMIDLYAGNLKNLVVLSGDVKAAQKSIDRHKGSEDARKVRMRRAHSDEDEDENENSSTTGEEGEDEEEEDGGARSHVVAAEEGPQSEEDDNASLSLNTDESSPVWQTHVQTPLTEQTGRAAVHHAWEEMDFGSQYHQN